ncbi:hypothetical protein [Mucilaginibacter lacusdianchii]|uniref:hypothetical protein n=1 Tax=Mucilaginibacter lacusdianchii TaxID=2684211 RepID=UPI00131A99A2|nr:hypothetical protein [Mucilaginibacter sp. JXJ CY 39]
MDTLVKGDKFSTTLSPGNYTWRIRAENGSTETAYSEPRSFTVVFSSIKNQKVQILAPTNNLLTNQSSITFSWGNLYGATRYQLQADTNGFADESKLVVNQTTPAQQFSYSLNKDQNYQWRIRAENDTAQSQWSTINTFTFDHTPPAVVSLTAPTADQSVSLPVNLQWAASSTAVKYRLYLYKGDSNTAFGNSFPMLLNTTSYTLTQGASLGDRIYWKLTALDAAGNESAPSTIRSFVLQ